MKRLKFFISLFLVSFTSGGISPVHDLATKINSKNVGDSLQMTSPHRVIQHLDNSIQRNLKNVTQNPKMDETLYKMAKDIVSAILSKLEVQDKITRMTKEALNAPGDNKGITAIETRRVLDYISRTLSGHILTLTRASTEPELHRLVYGMGQIAAEIAIVSALKDITYATALSKKQSVDLFLRKKRSIATTSDRQTAAPPTNSLNLNKSSSVNNTILFKAHSSEPQDQSSVIPLSRHTMQILNIKPVKGLVKGFLNQTVLDSDNSEKYIESDAIILEKKVNNTGYLLSDSLTLDNQEAGAPMLIDEWLGSKDNVHKPNLNPDVITEMEFDHPEVDNKSENEKKSKQKSDKLETKAKRAILYAGDVAYLTAASVVAMRRALTASIEVQMSVKFAKNALSSHQELMMNLARTAAQQAGKEARTAAAKSLACERVVKLALKYTSQSYGAALNHVANRIIMDTLSLGTLAKSMAFVSSEIAINSLYLATDVKSPPTS